MNAERIRNLVEIYYDVQDVRIRSFNRLRQIGSVEGMHPEALKKLETEIKKYIENEIKTEPIAKWLLKTKGIGSVLAGGILSYFDVSKTEHVSSFWKYAGLSVESGKAVKRKHGVKTDFNPRAKVLMWKVGDSFIKHRTPFYRDLYDKTKIEENTKLNDPLKNPKNCTEYENCMKRLKKAKKPSCKMHIHRRASRKMVKRFLADLWVEWRTIEGLPISEPYSHKT
jgi:hypothetical protein